MCREIYTSCRPRIQLEKSKSARQSRSLVNLGFSNKIPTDVPSQDVLHTLLRIPSLDDQSLLSIHTSARSQFGKQKLHQMLWLPVHSPANLGQVGKHGLFRSFTGDLRRNQGEFLLVPSQLGVVRVKQGVESSQEFGVSVVPRRADPRFFADFCRCRVVALGGRRCKHVVPEVTSSVFVFLLFSSFSLSNL